MSESSPTDGFASNTAAAGAGTTVAALGLYIGGDTLLGQIVLVAAPGVSVGLRWIAFYARQWVATTMGGRAADKARETLIGFIEDPNITPERKRHLEERLARLDDEVIDRALARASIASEPPSFASASDLSRAGD